MTTVTVNTSVAWTVYIDTEEWSPSIPEVLQSWGVEHSLNLAELASDYFLLYDLYLDSKDGGEFVVLRGALLDQFVNYTDMVIGGELRYIYSLYDGTTPIADEFVNEFCKPRAPGDGMNIGNRPHFWYKWLQFRRKYGTEALQMAVVVFNAFGGKHTQCGGPKWANIADVLLRFERQEITPSIFVDFCWGLEHNGGAYFNKVWQTEKLRKILDAKRVDNFTYLRRSASEGVKQMHKEQSKCKT